MILILSIIIFLISVIQILFNVFPAIERRGLIDFGVYWQALTRFLAGQNPYAGQGIPFNYPPSALLVLLPFKLFSRLQAEYLLTVLSFFSLWITLWITVKLSKIKISTTHFFLILAFFTQTFPVKFTLILGQINLIVLGLAYTTLYYCLANKGQAGGERRGAPTSRTYKLVSEAGAGARQAPPLITWAKNMASSFIMVLASSLKLFPLLTLPLFFITKNYFFTLTTIVIFVFLNLLPGPALAQKYYLQILPNISKSISYPAFYDQSILAFLLRLGLASPTAKIGAFLILAGLFILILYKFYNSYNRYNYYLLGFSLIFALISIAGLFSWQHHLVFSYPLILLIYLNLWQKKHRLGIKFYLFPIVVWLVLVFHFLNEHSPLLVNPFLASYQTVLILLLLTVSLWKKPLFRH